MEIKALKETQESGVGPELDSNLYFSVSLLTLPIFLFFLAPGIELKGT